MIVAKSVLEKYLSLRTEMEAIFNEVLMPRIREVCLHLHKFSPRSAHVTKTSVSVEDRRDSDSAYSIPIDLLFDENWESTVDAMLEKQRLRWEAESRRLTEQATRATEERERVELARLLAKYPQRLA